MSSPGPPIGLVENVVISFRLLSKSPGWTSSTLALIASAMISLLVLPGNLPRLAWRLYWPTVVWEPFSMCFASAELYWNCALHPFSLQKKKSAFSAACASATNFLSSSASLFPRRAARPASAANPALTTSVLRAAAIFSISKSLRAIALRSCLPRAVVITLDFFSFFRLSSLFAPVCQLRSVFILRLTSDLVSSVFTTPTGSCRRCRGSFSPILATETTLLVPSKSMALMPSLDIIVNFSLGTQCGMHPSREVRYSSTPRHLPSLVYWNTRRARLLILGSPVYVMVEERSISSNLATDPLDSALSISSRVNSRAMASPASRPRPLPSNSKTSIALTPKCPSRGDLPCPPG
mmetsp:Transcript_28270/g.42013  ORF Transcript_28270/g.42013 Transcript_28270/m.42013 type:complete len:350 (-) Transcript_28270:891-1940(-)